MANKPDRSPALEAFGRLLDIMDDLRAQCPWDKVQTEQTLRILTIEETYRLNVVNGKVVYKGVAEAFNLEYSPVETVLA